MHIDIIGLGYVGATILSFLSRKTSAITGIDIDSRTIEKVKSGSLPIFEPHLTNLECPVSAETSLPLSRKCDHRIYMICVGTPSDEHGDVDLSQVTSALTDVAKAINSAPTTSHTVILRSTVPPQTCLTTLIPLLEDQSHSKEGEGFNFYFFPEFLREGAALEDLQNPSIFAIGAPRSEVDHREHKLFQLFPGFENARIVALSTAETIKYLNNSFHALKISFVNEIAAIASSYKVSNDELFSLFLSDKKLNISESYLSPGLSFGGTCLTKDVRALTSLSKNHNIQTPLLDKILVSNSMHTQRLIDYILDTEHNSIGFIGVSFKPNTDDIRQSSQIDCIEALIKENRNSISVFDHPTVLAKLRSRFPNEHISTQESLPPLLEKCDLIILGSYQLTDKDLLLLSEAKKDVINLQFFTDFNQPNNQMLFP